MGWNVVIADDEAPAREELAYLLEQIEGVQLVAQAVNGMDAIKKVKEQAPDVLFLDIDMPDLNGLQVAQVIGELNPQVKIVFSTAYDHYAVEAFKLRAFHYMVKPYDERDLTLVFDELRKSRRGEREESPEQAAKPATGKTCVKLAIEVNGAIKYVSPKDIAFISKEGKFLQVHTREGAYGATYTLSELEKKLMPFGFFRCHKSYLVNLEYIMEMKTWVNGAYNVTIDDSAKSSIPVSRNYVKELRFKLEI